MKVHRSRAKRGVTLIEILIAALIIVTAVAAMFATFGTAFTRSSHNGMIVAAEEVARAQIETAKVYGPFNIPTGTYSTSTSTGTWTGAYIPATGWTVGGTAYYDGNGNQLTSSTGAVYSAQMTFTDSYVQQGSGTTYTIQSTSLRQGLCTVVNLTGITSTFQMATSLIQGGV